MLGDEKDDYNILESTFYVTISTPIIEGAHSSSSHSLRESPKTYNPLAVIHNLNSPISQTTDLYCRNLYNRNATATHLLSNSELSSSIVSNV